MFMKHYAPNRCEPRNEVIMKMGVQWGWGVGFSFGRVRVDVNVNEGLKYCENSKTKWGRGSWQGGCERRIKVFVTMQKIGVRGRVVESQGGCE